MANRSNEQGMQPILIIPGWMNSGPDHWQSRWESAHGYQRVQQQDWDSPVVADWVARLDEAIGASPMPPLLVAHSLGCIAVAHWAATHSSVRAAAAFLVAPADVEQADTPEPLRPFAPIPIQPLPFPTVVVASRDDPYATFDRAEVLARAWGAALVDAGMAGHLNTAAGLGPWPAGEALLHGLVTRLA